MYEPNGRQPSSKAAQSVSAAAEALFETKTVSEIRQIEARTRKDIDDKNQQLRQLVGDSYRDLIEGTDKVVDISTKCHAILANISSIQESFGRLAVSISTATANSNGKDYVRKHQELHAVGSRVKYIMDTPDIIWSCLDAEEYLEAARRLQRVHEVQQQLQTAFDQVVSMKFPLLSHQWPLVLKFRQQILDVATATLCSKPHLSTQEAADAVAAIALLEDLDTPAALQQLLVGRKTWAEEHLNQALADSKQTWQDAAQCLAQLSQEVQSCIAQVGELFTVTQVSSCSDTKSSSRCLVQQVLQEDEADLSELYFSGVTGSAEGNSSPEANSWRDKSDSICQKLQALPQLEVEQACSSWLSEIAAICDKQGLQLLQHCASAQSLLEAENTIQQAMVSWAPALAADGDTQQDIASASDEAALHKAASLALNGVSEAGSSGPSKLVVIRGRVVTAWDVVCDQVLGKKHDLWQVLYHSPFLARSQQLIAAALADACSSIQQPLTSAMQQAAERGSEPAGQLKPGVWPSISSHSDLVGGVLLDRTYSFSAGRTSSGVWTPGPPTLGYTASGVLVGMLSNAAQVMKEQTAVDDFRNEVHAIKRLFDSGLHVALQAVLLLTAAAAAADPSRSPRRLRSVGSQSISRAVGLAPTASQTLTNAVSNASTATGPAIAACTASGKARASRLEQYTQQRCAELVLKLAGDLQQRLSDVQSGPTGPAGIEQVLLVSRLCSAIAFSSTMLPVLLGSPEAWLSAAQSGPDAPSTPGTISSSSMMASIAHGISSLGPAAAELLRMHHPELSQHSSAAQAASVTDQLRVVQQQLHETACTGYVHWASWVASSLSAALLSALRGDELLHSDVTPLSWAETSLQAEGGEASDTLLDPLEQDMAGDMKFTLPAVPSSAVLQLLSWACWETRRAGEHLIVTDALQLLQWELHGATLKIIEQLAAPSAVGSNCNNAKVSEKGILQLLFDQRLLRDVLGAGRPRGATAGILTADAGAGGAAAELSARKKSMTSVEKLLQDQLDPIDWATYEPHLWNNVQKYYQRTSVLLGTLTQLHRPYAEPARAASAAAANSDLNTLNLLPTAPRFYYLPVSTPTAAHTTAAAAAKQRLDTQMGLVAVTAQAANGSGPAAAAAGNPMLVVSSTSAAASDLAAQFAFTDLRSSSSRVQASGVAQPARSPAGYGGNLHATAENAAAAGASALSALHARLQGSSFGALGSMLGDRAAEVTAMAQNFGDLLPSSGGLSGLGGGLGGLGGGVLSSFARRDGGQQAAASGNRT